MVGRLEIIGCQIGLYLFVDCPEELVFFGGGTALRVDSGKMLEYFTGTIEAKAHVFHQELDGHQLADILIGIAPLSAAGCLAIQLAVKTLFPETDGTGGNAGDLMNLADAVMNLTVSVHYIHFNLLEL
jgi:hypothetical protein